MENYVISGSLEPFVEVSHFNSSDPESRASELIFLFLTEPVNFIASIRFGEFANCKHNWKLRHKRKEEENKLFKTSHAALILNRFFYVCVYVSVYVRNSQNLF